MTLTTKLVAGFGGVAVALVAGTGLAQAAPGDEAIVNSTCTYPQVIAALNAQDPAAAGQVTSNPVATGLLNSLIAAPPAKRQQMIDQYRGFPQVQQNIGLISSVATTCNNF